MIIQTDHGCERGDIDWQKYPSIGDGNGDGRIPWHGRCRICKRKVMEYYYQDESGALLDRTTGEPI